MALITAYSHRWDNELCEGATIDQVLQAIRQRHTSATPEPVKIYPRENAPCGPGYPVRSVREPNRELAFSSRQDAVFYAQCHRDVGLLLDYLDVLLDPKPPRHVPNAARNHPDILGETEFGDLGVSEEQE